MNPLVIAAHPSETAPFAQFTNVEVQHFGVGAILSAQQIHLLAAAASGRDIIYIGTAGIFGPFNVPQLYLATTVAWSDIGLRSQKSYAIAGDLPRLSLLDKLPTGRHCPLERCEVVCSASITLEPALRPDSETSSHLLENVELYSVAGPILKVAKSFVAILATTNAVGIAAHQQWRTHAASAAELSANFVKQYMLPEPV